MEIIHGFFHPLINGVVIVLKDGNHLQILGNVVKARLSGGG